MLGVINWWKHRNTRAEVLLLVSRHYRPDDVLKANQVLSLKWNLLDPIQHKNSAPISAGEANAIDLLTNLKMLDSEKRALNFSYNFAQKWKKRKRTSLS